MTEQQRNIIANVERLQPFYGPARLCRYRGPLRQEFYLPGGICLSWHAGPASRLPDSPREVLLLWPRHGEPVLIVNHYAAPLARRDSWIQRVEVYDDYAESPYARLAAVLKDVGLQRETIGVEDLCKRRALGRTAHVAP